MNSILRRLIRNAAMLVLFGLPASVLAQSAGPAIADESLKGDAVCTKCHDETEKRKPVLSIYKTRHGVRADSRTPGCQSCHGASEAHIKNAANTDPRPMVELQFGVKDAAPLKQQEAVCLACHKTGQRVHWAGSEHERRDVTCTSCHSVHVREDRVLDRKAQPEVCFACHKAQRAQIHRISTHPILAGKMGCSECHNPHGSVGPKLMVKNSVTETCYTCHAEKRGPYLWEHFPVNEDCTNCHTPHGSNNAPLLARRPPWLCQECHTTDHSRDVNSGANLPGGNLTTINGLNPLANQSPRAQMNGRNCLACHALVHGSNHPAGARFSR
ncbi:MAG: Doubled motif protein [Betaproteobacteria bacterium]|nr:Doubled motif protein [Betaproteobacteria bacterium]